VKKLSHLLPAAVLAASLTAQTQQPTKIGIVHIQNAIISTKDGQKAAAELQAKFEPKRKELEAKQSEISQLQQQLSRGSNTMAEAQRVNLTREIDQKTKAFNRATEDAELEFQQEQGRILNENGYSLILDVSSPQTPVLFAANGIDVTQDIITLYDQTTASAPSASTPPPPAAPAPAKPAQAAKP
jgi:outer membrane protein